MLIELTIKNFALIHETHLLFHDGYTVITGETGSGKSILLNALGLLLGERFDPQVIGTAGDKAIVEAVFRVEEKKFTAFFAEHELDFFPQTIIRREISTHGRSRSFINDIPVSLAVLKLFSEQLISIHSQYNTLDLKRKEYQLQTLDILANTTQKQAEFEQLFTEYKQIKLERDQLTQQVEQQEKDREYNEFLLSELTELQLETINYAEIEGKLASLEHAHEIKQIQQQIIDQLTSENGGLEIIQKIKTQLTQLTRMDHSYSSIEERFISLLEELKDIQQDLGDIHQRQEQIDQGDILIAQQNYSEQLDTYNRQLLKHKAKNQQELIEIHRNLQAIIEQRHVLVDKLATLNKAEKEVYNQLCEHAHTLHLERKLEIPSIEKKIKHTLADLKLPDTELFFSVQESEHINAYGCTVLSILFSANKGHKPVEIERAASGGELSRVMLALQQFISEKKELPSIFFDEIDTGVSGDVAEKIGILLRQMGKRMQLFAISHLPQVAAKASHHLKVEKQTIENRSQTQIRVLQKEEKIQEIARLMSGETINKAAISNAKLLINS